MNAEELERLLEEAANESRDIKRPLLAAQANVTTKQ
jgi:hypothetical protein